MSFLYSSAMNRVHAIFLMTSMFLGACSIPGGLPEPKATAFELEGVQVIEPGISRHERASLRVRGGQFEQPGESGAALPVLTEYEGMFVLPGLIDMHTHLPPDTALRLSEYFGLLYLAHGVTTVRDAGDLDGSAVPAAEAAQAAGAPMPHLRSCGAFVGGAEQRWDNWIHLSEPGGAPEIAARLRAQGRVCVKVYDGLDLPRVRAIVEAAVAEGLVPMGHVPFGISIEEARIPDTQHLMGVTPPEKIEAGNHVVHRIMDWRAVDHARIDEVIAASVEHGITHTPTLGLSRQILHFSDYAAALEDPTLGWMPGMYREVVWHPADGIPLYRDLTPADFAMMRDAFPKKLRLVAGLHQAGVPLRLGTDTQQPFVVPGASIWQELRLFGEAGISAEEAWAYGSWRSAPGLGATDVGRLQPGAPADLLIFREDPTADLDALDSLEAVVVGGKLYPRADLLAALSEWRGFYESPLVNSLAKMIARQLMADSIKGDH